MDMSACAPAARGFAQCPCTSGAQQARDLFIVRLEPCWRSSDHQQSQRWTQHNGESLSTTVTLSDCRRSDGEARGHGLTMISIAHGGFGAALAVLLTVHAIFNEI